MSDKFLCHRQIRILLNNFGTKKFPHIQTEYFGVGFGVAHKHLTKEFVDNEGFVFEKIDCYHDTHIQNLGYPLIPDEHVQIDYDFSYDIESNEVENEI